MLVSIIILLYDSQITLYTLTNIILVFIYKFNNFISILIFRNLNIAQHLVTKISIIIIKIDQTRNYKFLSFL